MKGALRSVVAEIQPYPTIPRQGLRNGSRDKDVVSGYSVPVSGGSS